MGVDQDTEHAKGFIVFDKAHAAHVRGQVEDKVGTLDGTMAGVELLQVGGHIVYAGVYLVPLVARLNIDRPDYVTPSRSSCLIRWPPMKPPPPQTTTFP